MSKYFARRDLERSSLQARYELVGFISSGTYGRVYKARRRVREEGQDTDGWYAIKKFKPDKEEGGGNAVGGGQAQLAAQTAPLNYHGLSQSAVREMALCRELKHKHVIRLAEVMLEDRAVLLSFEYAEYDFLVGG